MQKLMFLVKGLSLLVLAFGIAGLYTVTTESLSTNQFWAGWVVVFFIDLTLWFLAIDEFYKVSIYDKQDLSDVEFGNDISADI